MTQELKVNDHLMSYVYTERIMNQLTNFNEKFINLVDASTKNYSIIGLFFIENTARDAVNVNGDLYRAMLTSFYGFKLNI